MCAKVTLKEINKVISRPRIDSQQEYVCSVTLDYDCVFEAVPCVSFFEPELRIRNYEFSYDEPLVSCFLYDEYVVWIERPFSGALRNTVYLFNSVDYIAHFNVDVFQTVLTNLTDNDFCRVVRSYEFCFPEIRQLAYAESEDELLDDPSSLLVYLQKCGYFWNNIQSPKLISASAPRELLKSVHMFSGKLNDLAELSFQVSKYDCTYGIRFLSNPFFPFWVEMPEQYAVEVSNVIWS